MYLYELAIATGERSTDLIERAKILGFEIGPHDELTREQVEALSPGRSASDGPLDAGSPTPAEPPGEPDSGEGKGPGSRFRPRRRGRASGVDSPEAGPVISGSGAGGSRRIVLMAAPVLLLVLGAVWFMTKDQDAKPEGPDEDQIGLQVRSERLSGDPHGVNDRARFCDEGGRLIVLTNAGGPDPSTADLRAVWVERQNDIAEHLVAIVATTEGETQEEAKEYRRHLTEISNGVRALPSANRVESLPRSAKMPLVEAMRDMASLDLSHLEAAMAAHC